MPDGQRPDVLLLDFGGVCLLNPVELHDHTERTLGLAPGTLTWQGPIDPSGDELWQQMTNGDGITERDYWAIRAKEVGALVGRDFSVGDYMRLLYEPSRPELIRTQATEVVGAAQAAGFGVSVLTNDLKAFHGTEWQNGIEFLSMIDHLVDCSDTNILKPDARAFSRALDIIGVAAEQVLFVDDLPRNVQGARDAGLHAVWFDVANAADSWADVGRRLGL